VIPLGILAAAGGAVASVGSYDLLATEILTSSSSSITFSSLGDYAADYEHLQVRMVARSNRADTGSYMYVQFNGDTGSNYNYHDLQGTGSAVNSNATSGSYPSGILDKNFSPAATDPSNSFGVGTLDILDPFETSKYTTARTLSGQSSNSSRIGLTSGAWRNTASLTSITFDDIFGSFVTGSRFSLYGLKASA